MHSQSREGTCKDSFGMLFFFIIIIFLPKLMLFLVKPLPLSEGESFNETDFSNVIWYSHGITVSKKDKAQQNAQ